MICSTNTFALADLPVVDSIIWEHGPYLTVSSGQNTSSCTFSAIGSGSSWVRARLVSGCGSITLPQKNVLAGPPNPADMWLNVLTSGGSTVTDQYGYAELCPNTTYHIYCHNDGTCLTSNYSWSIPSGWTQYYTWQNMVSINTNSSPGGRVEVSANTCCGTNEIVLIDYLGSSYNCESYYMMFSPNPTSSETTLSIESTSEEKTFDETAEWELEIYSPSQTLKEKKPNLKGKSTTIQTQSWKEGVYVVRVKYKDEILTGKLVVKK